MDAQILPTFKTLLGQPQLSPEVIMQVIWCYGNIAGESLALRDMILADNVVYPMAIALD